jgi:hypothetical protein
LWVFFFPLGTSIFLNSENFSCMRMNFSCMRMSWHV